MKNRIPRRFEVTYDAHTQSVVMLDSLDAVSHVVAGLRNEMMKLNSALILMTAAKD